MLKKYPHNALIRAAVSGCSDLVVRDGLNYLIPEWKKFAQRVQNYSFGLDDYLNDLDTRKIIDRILALLTKEEITDILQEIEPYDKQFITKTLEVKECLWGQDNEALYGYTREKNFYYYRAPQYIIDECRHITGL